MTADKPAESLPSSENGALLKLVEELDSRGRPAEATEALSRAANRGDLRARYLVGRRLLVGQGALLLPQDGIRLIEEAASHVGDAAHLLAVIYGLGAYVPNDWSRALDFLQTAAELGSVLAQQELALIAGKTDRDAKAAGAGAAWRDLRRRVDISPWQTPAAEHLISADPHVGAFADFLPRAACAWLIERARPALKRAQIYTGGAASVGSARTNTSAAFNLLETNFINVVLQARMAAAAGVALGQLEAIAVLHYGPGEIFSDHFDFVDPRSPEAGVDIARYGQRILTFLVYLNEDYAGGETAFARLGLSHKGKTGEGLVFRNTLADGAPDLRTLHAGRAPTSGEKWVVSQFIRSRPIVPGTERPHAHDG